ncbi:MAG TPA: aminopeptidase P family protein, partial [Pyrinomonadaceae bacterium]
EPPAPVWDERERLAELAARRARVAEFVGPNSVLVLLGAEPRVYTGDVDYEYRQENNLYYLTHLNQPGARFVLMPGHGRHREVLFLPRPVPAREVWEGRMYTAEAAMRLSGVNEIWDAGEFEPFMRALLERKPFRPKNESVLLAVAARSGPGSGGSAADPVGYDTIFAAMGRKESSLYMLTPGAGEAREFRQEREAAARWAKPDSGLTPRSAWPIFVRLRQVKSPAEVRLIQHAVNLTARGIGRALAAATRSGWEYQFEAEIEYAFRSGNARVGYPSIVACGENATILHYTESSGQCRDGELLLMDVGAEYGHYSADVTRTVPVSGRFTPAQAEIYNAVLAAQEAALRAARPGATLSDVHNAAVRSLKESLLRLGLITERNSTQHGLWFMHGTSHWLGMNVHDVGANDARLEPGMVFTVEPGLYFRADALERLPQTAEWRRFAEAVRPAFEKYKNIGVRVEDDVVITAEGHRNLSAAVPRTVAEIEAAMK